MVRSAFVSDTLSSYFTSIAKQNPYAVGLILGQSVSGKDYVVHFAKTPPYQPDPSKEADRLKNIDDINEECVADHARQVTKMLPGGMHVLGLFIVTPDDVLKSFSSKIKGVINSMHNALGAYKYLHGNPCDGSEKLVVNYCSLGQQYACKSYDVATSSVKPAEIKFVPNSSNKWVQIECKYHFDHIYHIEEGESQWPLKKHMAMILSKVNDDLGKSAFLFDGEIKDIDDSIDTIGKKKKIVSRNNKGGSAQEEPVKSLEICVLQPCKMDDQLFKISESGNQIRMVGHVTCRLWLNPKMSISGASNAIIQDIMRSLSTRFDMHIDSLTEEEHGEDVNSVHEPPRRVLIPLPNNKIALSDYLFPGEGPQDALASIMDLADIRSCKESDVMDIEGQADLADYYNEALESESEDLVTLKNTESNMSLFFIGFGVAILVLVISLLIHFVQG